MFKKLMSVALLSFVAGGAFAAPDPIEADLAASVARAAKAEDEAKDVLRAAHVRALKSRISANEMAVRRLKTRLAATKDADAKAAIEARAAELTDEVTSLTAETQVKVEVTIGEVPAAAPAQAGAAAAQAPVRKIGPFTHVAGVWKMAPHPNAIVQAGQCCVMVITPEGEVLTGSRGTLHRTAAAGRIAHTDGQGVLSDDPLILVNPRKLRQKASGCAWERISPEVPEADTIQRGGFYTSVIMDEAHTSVLEAFVRTHPLK